MSYFLISTGVVPSIDDIPALRLVAASQAKGYVSDIVADTLESADHAVTYLLDDGTHTSDAVVAEASDQIASGVAFETTRLGQVVRRLLDADCAIRAWWPSQAGGLPRLDVFDDQDQFLARLTERLTSGADLNCAYRSRPSSGETA